MAKDEAPKKSALRAELRALQKIAKALDELDDAELAERVLRYIAKSRGFELEPGEPRP